MSLDLEKLRYDLSLAYAKAHYKADLTDNSLNHLGLEGPIDVQFVEEINSLKYHFGRAYRELSLTSDDALLLQMKLKGEYPQPCAEEAPLQF